MKEFNLSPKTIKTKLWIQSNESEKQFSKYIANAPKMNRKSIQAPFIHDISHLVHDFPFPHLAFIELCKIHTLLFSTR